MVTVTIREKEIAKGRKSLYLDIYDKGKRKRESLDMFLQPEVNSTVKAENKRTLKLAEVARLGRLAELQDEKLETAHRKKTHTIVATFAEFLRGRNCCIYTTLLHHLQNYCKAGEKVTQINERWVENFVFYLRSRGLIENTAWEYIRKMRVFWKYCTKQGLVEGNPFADVKFNTRSAKREYLTIDELQQLINTPTKKPVRNMFLFSCLTGLRYSDVKELRWENVEQSGGRTRIIYRQQKTGEQEYMDLNAQAVELMGERRDDDILIFGSWTKSTCTANSQLRHWTKRAGIRKNITFHCSRHTFATMLLTLNADIYTVSKLLGHTNITTTQVYAKIVDKKKQDAVDSIPQLL